jgi:hypothetical protein
VDTVIFFFHIHAFSSKIKIAFGVYLILILYFLYLVSFCAYVLQSLREIGCEDEKRTGRQMSCVVASFDVSSDEFLGSVVSYLVILLSAEWWVFNQRRLL